MSENLQPKKKFDLQKSFPWMVSSALAIALVTTVIVNNVTAESKQAVATVNGEKITQGQLYKNLKQQYGSDSLTQMINQVLIAQAAKKKKVTITAAEMTAEVNKIKAQFDTEQAFQDSLKQYNMTLADLKKQITTQKQVEKLLSDTIVITDQEYKTEFDRMKKEKIDAGQIRASHILVKTEKEALAIYKEIKAGGDFATIAKSKSTDTGSGANGGDLGYFAKADMVKEFSNAAFSLKENEVSKPVKSQYGYHIIKVTDLPSTWTLSEKKAEIKATLTSSKLSEATATYLDTLTKSAKITKKL
jgi:foldase protein PrsA